MATPECSECNCIECMPVPNRIFYVEETISSDDGRERSTSSSQSSENVAQLPKAKTGGGCGLRAGFLNTRAPPKDKPVLQETARPPDEIKSTVSNVLSKGTPSTKKTVADKIQIKIEQSKMEPLKCQKCSKDGLIEPESCAAFKLECTDGCSLILHRECMESELKTSKKKELKTAICPTDGCRHALVKIEIRNAGRENEYELYIKCDVKEEPKKKEEKKEKKKGKDEKKHKKEAYKKAEEEEQEEEEEEVTNGNEHIQIPIDIQKEPVKVKMITPLPVDREAVPLNRAKDEVAEKYAVKEEGEGGKKKKRKEKKVIVPMGMRVDGQRGGMDEDDEWGENTSVDRESREESLEQNDNAFYEQNDRMSYDDPPPISPFVAYGMPPCVVRQMNGHSQEMFPPPHPQYAPYTTIAPMQESRMYERRTEEVHHTSNPLTLQDIGRQLGNPRRSSPSPPLVDEDTAFPPLMAEEGLLEHRLIKFIQLQKGEISLNMSHETMNMTDFYNELNFIIEAFCTDDDKEVLVKCLADILKDNKRLVSFLDKVGLFVYQCIDGEYKCKKISEDEIESKDEMGGEQGGDNDRNTEEDELKRAIQDSQESAALENQRRIMDEIERKKEEDDRRKREEEERLRREEEEKRRKEEMERMKKEEEEKRRKVEEEDKRRKEEELRERIRIEQEEKRRRMEEATKKRQEEEEKMRIEVEKKRKENKEREMELLKELEANKKKKEEEIEKKRADGERMQRQQEERRNLRIAEEEMAKKKADEEKLNERMSAMDNLRKRLDRIDIESSLSQCHPPSSPSHSPIPCLRSFNPQARPFIPSSASPSTQELVSCNDGKSEGSVEEEMDEQMEGEDEEKWNEEGSPPFSPIRHNNEQLAELENEILDLDTMNKSLTNKLKQRDAKLKEFEEKLNKLKSDRRELEDELRMGKSENEELKNKMILMDGNIRTLQSTIEVQRRESEKDKAQMSEKLMNESFVSHLEREKSVKAAITKTKTMFQLEKMEKCAASAFIHVNMIIECLSSHPYGGTLAHAFLHNRSQWILYQENVKQLTTEIEMKMDVPARLILPIAPKLPEEAYSLVKEVDLNRYRELHTTLFSLAPLVKKELIKGGRNYADAMIVEVLRKWLMALGVNVKYTARQAASVVSVALGDGMLSEEKKIEKKQSLTYAIGTSTNTCTSKNPWRIHSGVNRSVELRDKECQICYDHLLDADIMYCESSTCREPYHTHCIKQWLAEKPTCPNCNRSFPHPELFPSLQ